MTGADALVKSLEQEGVSLLFGYPGAAITDFYDSLSRSDIRHILVRQEQNAGHAANGYARISGRPGVCVTTSGPGATNLITALATAYMDSIPMVAITGQVPTALLGRDVFQEADITGAAEPFTKYSYLVKNADDIPRIVKEAFHIASTGRPGPVLIDIPKDVQKQKTTFSWPEKIDIRGYKPTIKGHMGQIKRVVRALNNAERPVICAGGGVFAANAQDTLVHFAEELNIPVVSTLMGIGAIPTEHPLYMGMLGGHGRASANEVMYQSDLLLIIGARVSDRAVLLPTEVERTTKIVHIDIDPAEIGKNVSTSIPIVGDIDAILNQILEEKPAKKLEQRIEELTEQKNTLKLDLEEREKTVNPRWFLDHLVSLLPADHIYCADVGQNQIWSAMASRVTRNGRFLTSGGMGTMGYSIPAAVGAKLADPEKFVIAVCGDGSFQMEMMELGTINQHHIPVKMVVMNNNNLGLVREIQKKAYARNYCAVDLYGSPDAVMIAKAFGIPGRRVHSKAEAEEAIQEMLATEGAYLLECIVDMDEFAVVEE